MNRRILLQKIACAIFILSLILQHTLVLNASILSTLITGINCSLQSIWMFCSQILAVQCKHLHNPECLSFWLLVTSLLQSN